jgi:hypothetical protein
MKEPEATTEGENKPDFDLFILTLNHIVESGHNDIRFREAAERFVKPLQEESKEWEELFYETQKIAGQTVSEMREEIKTLRQQLEQYKSEQKQDS